MLLLSRFFGRSIRRPSPSRRPHVESLEGRQLLSAVAVVQPDIQGSHIGTSVVVAIKHVPMDLNPQPLPPG